MTKCRAGFATAANSNFAYFIKLTTALECQKQLLMSSISNLGGRESLETAVILYVRILCFCNVWTEKKNVYRKTGNGIAFAGKQRHVDISCQNSVFTPAIFNNLSCVRLETIQPKLLLLNLLCQEES